MKPIKPASRIHVIGVTPGRLVPEDPSVCDIVERADLLVGREELLRPWEGRPSLVLRGDLNHVIKRAEQERARGRTVVFLVYGDPDFFGIAPLIRRLLGKEKVVTHPALSSMQLAFSRVGESWHDAHFFSVHARPLEEVLSGLRRCDKACVLTADGKQPADLAKVMIRDGMNRFRVFLCEDLGSEEERVEEVSLEALSRRVCRPLNLLLFLANRREQKFEFSPPLLGIPDEHFVTPPGRERRMTKRDLRAVALSRLMLSPHETLWDVGAGCGTLSIEASRLLLRGRVYAVEEDEEDVEVIRSNVRRFGAFNVHPVKGMAPEVLEELPSPHAVFVGGSSGRLEGIVFHAAERIGEGGRIVINLVGMEKVLEAARYLEEAGLIWEASLHQVHFMGRLGGAHVLRPQNPVFVVSGRKPSNGGKRFGSGVEEG